MPLIIADGIGSILSNPSENLIMLAFVVGLVLLVLVISIGAIWHQIRKSDIEASLKQTMIQSGMSADEIEPASWLPRWTTSQKVVLHSPIRGQNRANSGERVSSIAQKRGDDCPQPFFQQ